jgi:hypothetical protein
MILVLESSRCVGFLRPTAKGPMAYNADGHPLGLFPDNEAAVAVINKAGLTAPSSLAA